MNVEELKQAVAERFDFLVSDFGFRGPKVSASNMYFTLGYCAGEKCIDVQVELADFFIYVLPSKREGDEPVVGYTDERGRVQKRHLQDVLMQLSVMSEPEAAELGRLAGDYDNWDTISSKLARLLRDNLPLIIAEWERLFPVDG